MSDFKFHVKCLERADVLYSAFVYLFVAPDQMLQGWWAADDLIECISEPELPFSVHSINFGRSILGSTFQIAHSTWIIAFHHCFGFFFSSMLVKAYLTVFWFWPACTSFLCSGSCRHAISSKVYDWSLGLCVSSNVRGRTFVYHDHENLCRTTATPHLSPMH